MKRLLAVLLALCLFASVAVAATVSLKINSGEALETQFAAFREYLGKLPSADRERWNDALLEIVVTGLTQSYDSQWPSSSSGGNSNSAGLSTGKRNALQSAKDYLNYTAFSYTGLIRQLEYEGYSDDEARYGADNCGADWNQQAARCAKAYLNYTSFSRKGLIDQLVYEGFTQSQAE
ncbi:MAG TPA: Ltp family lipoprotein [Candidatus Limnocylindria bacterium]|nr:Ltp family lipoprotein [Candidatus Limnocylindria bacterium]